jgi:hypothetical protein
MNPQEIASKLTGDIKFNNGLLCEDELKPGDFVQFVDNYYKRLTVGKVVDANTIVVVGWYKGTRPLVGQWTPVAKQVGVRPLTPDMRKIGNPSPYLV